MKEIHNIESLITDFINEKFEISPRDLYVTGVTYLYQIPQFFNSKTKHFNYYLLQN